MAKGLILDERELKEIHHALHYSEVLAHGTAGHNMLMLIAKLADAFGFHVDQTDVLMFEGQNINKIPLHLTFERTKTTNEGS
jgi:hypothetical protein